MPRPVLEVADIFRAHGPARRDANRGHVSLGQLKVMSAIERCRTAALGGHVLRCENGACGYTTIAYNSCRNRRRLMIEKLLVAHAAGQLDFYGAHAALVDATAFAAYLAPLKRTRWFVYAKRPFAGPNAVLAYLSRYTHRVAISNWRLIAADAKAVTFKVKDYRIEGPGRQERKKPRRAGQLYASLTGSSAIGHSKSGQDGGASC